MCKWALIFRLRPIYACNCTRYIGLTAPVKPSGILQTHKLVPSWLDSSVGRVLHSWLGECGGGGGFPYKSDGVIIANFERNSKRYQNSVLSA